MAFTFKELGNLGRLGNQLSQIASTIGIARKNNANVYFGHWAYEGYFRESLPKYRSALTEQRITEKNFHYDKYYLPSGMNYDMFGYFQSPKYWEHCEEEIRRRFTFDAKFIGDISLKAINPLGCVSIHVRRGDYLKLPDYHTNLDMSYYKRAMDLFPDGMFMVFSDDIEWCKEQFKGERFIFSEGMTEIEDLLLMTNCDHHIIANSSFSWWGAYLGWNPNKKVVAPRDWFGPKNSHLNTKDLYCKNWIRI